MSEKVKEIVQAIKLKATNVAKDYCVRVQIVCDIQGCIEKFPDWLPGVRTANGTALYH
jgi:hypothetical protein